MSFIEIQTKIGLVKIGPHAQKRMKTRGISSDDLKDAINNPKRFYPDIDTTDSMIYVSSSGIKAVLNSSTLFLITVVRATNGYAQAKNRHFKNELTKKLKRKYGSKAGCLKKVSRLRRDQSDF